MDMGVSCSVYSTGLGAAVMIVISLFHFFQKRGCLRFCWPKYQIRTVLESFRTGFSTSVQYIYQFVTILVCNHLLMAISGELGVAVFGIVFNVALVAASVYDAISMALQPMVSTFHGECNKPNIRCTLKQAFRVSMVVNLVIVALLVAAPQWISFAFGLRTDAELAMGSAAIRIYALCVIPSGINMVLTYYYQALGREFISYMLFTLRSFVFFLAFSLILSLGGIDLFWWTYPCMELATLAVLAVYNRRKGSWAYLDEDDSRVFSAFVDSRDADLGAVSKAVSEYLEGIHATAAQSYFAAIAAEEVCAVILSQPFPGSEGYIQFTIVPHDDGTVTLHLRDNAKAFNPFDLDVDEISLEDGRGLDALGIKMIKNKAKEFFYRRYAGFNTLVIRV